MEKYQGIVIFELMFQAVNCEWDQWGSWTLCTKTCGGGVSTRNRVIKVNEAYRGDKCIGEPIETMKCQTQLCSKLFLTIDLPTLSKNSSRGLNVLVLESQTIWETNAGKSAKRKMARAPSFVDMI